MCAVVSVHVVLSLLAPRGFALTAFGDILQNLILLCATVAVLSNVKERLPEGPACSGRFWVWVWGCGWPRKSCGLIWKSTCGTRRPIHLSGM